MASTTTNLSLVTYNSTTDGSASFLTFRTDVDGVTTSNMVTLDNFAGSTSASLVSLAARNQIVRVEGSKISGNYFWAASVPEISGYSTDTVIMFIPDTTISGSTTLKINSLDIKSLKKIDDSGNKADLSSGDLKKIKEYLFRYDGVDWVWVSATSSDQASVTGTINDILIIGSGSFITDSGSSIANIISAPFVTAGSVAGFTNFRAAQSGSNVSITSTGSQMLFNFVAGSSAPASASALGYFGQMSISGSYLYVCIATNTWRRSLLEIW